MLDGTNFAENQAPEIAPAARLIAQIRPHLRLIDAEWPHSPAATQSVNVTLFPDRRAKIKAERKMTLAALALRIQIANAKAKADLPWLKLAWFGGMPSDKGSLRHNDNVLAVNGVEGDYDAEKISFEEACEICKQADFLALIYTSPSYTLEKPRWRVLCPFSAELSPGQRERMMARLNGVFGGVFAPESFILSQSYYYGSVGDNPPPRVELIDGTPIDLRPALDASAIGKSAKTTAAAPGQTNVIPFALSGAPPAIATTCQSVMAARAQANMPEPAPHWFGDLQTDVQNDCLETILRNPRFIERAKAPGDQWRLDAWGIADAARLGADRAYDYFLEWCRKGGAMYTGDADCESVWRRFDPNRANVGHLIKVAGELEIDLSRFRGVAPKGSIATTVVPTAPLWVDDDEWVEVDIPRRSWVARKYALRGSVTMVFGPPSAMKSSLMLAWGCSVALGRPHGEFQPTAPGTVIVYNCEDDRTEQHRRLSAALRQFNATPADIRGKVIRVGPSKIGTLYTADKKTGVISVTPAMAGLRNLIAERKPALLIADPLVELHDSDENDNTPMRAVIAEFRALAVEFDLAVVLLHHTRKGTVTPGDPDSGRGASSTVGAGRVVLTLVTMSENDAEALGFPEDRKTRSRYVRLDDARQSYAGLEDAQWYEKVLYTLGNNEVVPAAVPWQPPNVRALLTPIVARQILEDIDAGLDGGTRRYSDASAATDRAAWKVVIRHIPDYPEKQARKLVQEWVKNGFLVKREYDDPMERKPRDGIYAPSEKTAS